MKEKTVALLINHLACLSFDQVREAVVLRTRVNGENVVLSMLLLYRMISHHIRNNHNLENFIDYYKDIKYFLS